MYLIFQTFNPLLFLFLKKINVLIKPEIGLLLLPSVGKQHVLVLSLHK